MVIATTDPDVVNGIYYPSSDGEPLAESNIHVDAIFQLKEFLDDLYSDRSDVFVGCNQFWFWEEGNPEARRAPDIYLALGVVARDEPRRSFKSWLENGVIPQFITEIASQKKWRADVEVKYELYERLGVQEYFVFDPEALFLDPPLRGWRLVNGIYQSIPVNPDGSLTSRVLGMRIIAEGMKLRLIDDRTGQTLSTRLERIDDAERRAAAQAAEIEESKRQAAAQAAEIARLKAQLDALTTKDKPPQP